MKFPKLTHSLLLFLFAIILVPTSPIRPVAGLGFDASWHQALAMALNQKIVFGKDIIFRFGPLGFLETGFLPETVHVLARLLFDLYILFNLLFVIHFALKKARKTWVAVIALVCMIAPWGYIADATFTLLFLFLFNLFHANQNRRSFSLYNAVFIAALMFFIKLNFSLVISILLYATLIYLWVTKRFSWREIIVVLITHLFLIYWGAYHLNVDINGYLVSSINIIENYDDSNAQIQLNTNLLSIILFLAISITLFTLIVFFKNVKQIYKRQDYLFTFLMVFSAMYLCLKQQFTLINTQNGMAYFLFMPPLLSLLWMYLRDTDRWFSRLVLVSLVFSIFAFQLLRYEKSGSTTGYFKGFFPKEVQFFNAKYGDSINKKFEPIIDLLFILKLHSPYGYIKSLTDNKFQTYFPKYNFQNRALPQEILTIIGENSVDILPSEISYIFYNKLNYNPRPTLQSNQAVGRFLDNKNAEKYKSKSAPNFVLSQYIEQNNTNLLWQETLTKLSFIQNYQKIKTFNIPQKNAKNKIVKFDTISLYANRQNKIQFIEKKILNNKIKFGQKIKLASNKNILILKTNFKYSFLGLVSRYFFQAPYVYCNLTFNDGTMKQYRAIVPQFDQGIIINKIVNNNRELDEFFNQKTINQKLIKTIHFETKNEWGFLPTIVYELTEFSPSKII